MRDRISRRAGAHWTSGRGKRGRADEASCYEQQRRQGDDHGPAGKMLYPRYRLVRGQASEDSVHAAKARIRVLECSFVPAKDTTLVP